MTTFKLRSPISSEASYIIMIEHSRKHPSLTKFQDHCRPHSSLAPSHPIRPALKHTSDKIYTQTASSRTNPKHILSTHHSPIRPKPDKLTKTSVLNFLQKCSSEYEEQSTATTNLKSHKNLKGRNEIEDKMVGTTKKEASYIGRQKKDRYHCLLDRAEQLLDGFREKISELEREGVKYQWQLEQAHLRISELQRAARKSQKHMKNSRKAK